MCHIQEESVLLQDYRHILAKIKRNSSPSV